jgi:hypothetical protein
LGDLKLNKIPDFGRGAAKELEGYLHLFLDLGWCTKGDGYLDTYARLAVAFNSVEEKIEQIISDIVSRTENMKQFLIVHSVFSRFAYSQGDWLEKYMIQLLTLTDEDIEWFNTAPYVPKDIMEKLSILDPEPIRYLIDPIIVEYKMWGNSKNGESYDPINVIDLDWKDLHKNFIKIEDRIKQYSVIEL